MRGARVRTGRFAVAGVVAALALAGCSDGQVGRDDAAGGEAGYITGDGTLTLVDLADREAAPEFNAPLLDGSGEFSLTEAEGEIVVLNVWASWCPPCRKEAPDLQEVSEELAADGVRFVGVNTKDTSERAALQFEDEFGVTYPSVYDPDGIALLAFRDTMPPQSIPSTIVIDREGRLAALALGAISGPTLRDIVADIAAEETTADTATTTGG